MTFNENANVGDNRARRRGRNAAIAGGSVVGFGAIAALVINLLTGGSMDVSGLLGGGGAPQPASGGGESEIENCDTGADANARDDCRLAATSLNLDKYWEKNVQGYREPGLVIVDGSTSTQCGTASNAAGPFYCPPEQTVYIDPSFFAILREQFDANAGPLAQVYVLAHEYGHHVQNITGIMDQYPNNGSGVDSNGVRIELQADCFAGAWVANASNQVDSDGVAYMKEPTEQQLRDALNAAASVGDDHIQQESGGFVNPESWTHGSSEQRQRWFATGYKFGLDSCDTFSVGGGAL